MKEVSLGLVLLFLGALGACSGHTGRCAGGCGCFTTPETCPTGCKAVYEGPQFVCLEDLHLSDAGEDAE